MLSRAMALCAGILPEPSMLRLRSAAQKCRALLILCAQSGSSVFVSSAGRRQAAETS